MHHLKTAQVHAKDLQFFTVFPDMIKTDILQIVEIHTSKTIFKKQALWSGDMECNTGKTDA